MMNEPQAKLPWNWSLDVNESSVGVYRIVAAAKDGRRIEAVAFDKDVEQKTNNVIQSIQDSDRQVSERYAQPR
jgi:hypothetical protein